MKIYQASIDLPAKDLSNTRFKHSKLFSSEEDAWKWIWCKASQNRFSQGGSFCILDLEKALRLGTDHPLARVESIEVH